MGLEASWNPTIYIMFQSHSVINPTSCFSWLLLYNQVSQCCVVYRYNLFVLKRLFKINSDSGVLFMGKNNGSSYALKMILHAFHSGDPNTTLVRCTWRDEALVAGFVCWEVGLCKFYRSSTFVLLFNSVCSMSLL